MTKRLLGRNCPAASAFRWFRWWEVTKEEEGASFSCSRGGGREIFESAWSFFGELASVEVDFLLLPDWGKEWLLAMVWESFSKSTASWRRSAEAFASAFRFSSYTAALARRSWQSGRQGPWKSSRWQQHWHWALDKKNGQNANWANHHGGNIMFWGSIYGRESSYDIHLGPTQCKYRINKYRLKKIGPKVIISCLIFFSCFLKARVEWKKVIPHFGTKICTRWGHWDAAALHSPDMWRHLVTFVAAADGTRFRFALCQWKWIKNAPPRWALYNWRPVHGGMMNTTL